MAKYYVVSEEILPHVLSKVIEAQNLLLTGQAGRISEAVRKAGISRGTYYKYRDAVFSFNSETSKRKAIMNLVVHDHKGALSRILSLIADKNCSVMAINQTIPINELTNVVLTLDISETDCSIQELSELLKDLEYVERAELVAVE